MNFIYCMRPGISADHKEQQTVNGRQRIITALENKQPDCVPLYIHGINEAPIIGIGRHLAEGLPEPKDFRLMNDHDKLKLVDTLFMIHEHYDVDGITTFETGHETRVDAFHVTDGFNVVYRFSPHGIPVPVGHPVPSFEALKSYKPLCLQPGIWDFCTWLRTDSREARLLSGSCGGFLSAPGGCWA
ncbi:MAG: hypothetical protein K9K40_14620 [Desulfotignum sp.]|nr:hypothetical protein [Desulfotignum sp.]